jgi:hypothetical protein
MTYDPPNTVMVINMETEMMYYDSNTGMLHGTQLRKALSFIKHECIKKQEDGTFLCLPLKDYNKTTYTIIKNEHGRSSCTCQYNTTKGLSCSHILAVNIYSKSIKGVVV